MAHAWRTHSAQIHSAHTHIERTHMARARMARVRMALTWCTQLDPAEVPPRARRPLPPLERPLPAHQRAPQAGVCACMLHACTAGRPIALIPRVASADRPAGHRQSRHQYHSRTYSAVNLPACLPACLNVFASIPLHTRLTHDRSARTSNGRRRA